MTPIRYQVGGALLQDVSSYVTRDSDRQLLEALKAGEFCYVLNSRQMGKSSLMVRTLAQLQESGWKGIILDFSAKDTQSDQPSFWYNGIINQLNNHFKLLDRGDFRTWLKERDFISPVERLGEFIETVLLPGIIEPIIIFVDEIDSTLGLPFTDDFFALIRACYNRRAEKPDYKRLTFALLGVAAPSELIGDTKRTPFNIGTSIDLSGFTLAEAQPLAAGLAGKSENPQAVLKAILYWTGGQPFLSQRLCQLVADSSVRLVAGHEDSMIEELVRSRLIENWESQDQQSHLKTIRDRVIKNEQKAGYLLELYRQTRQAGSLPVQNRPEEQELQLSGLVVKREGNLQVYNPIYAEVFNESWIDSELAKLRPYAESFRAWVISGKIDKSRLLRGDALKEAEQWAKAKNPSAEDQDFLSESRIQEREEEFAVKKREGELERERQDKEAAEERAKKAEEAKQILAAANNQAQKRLQQAITEGEEKRQQAITEGEEKRQQAIDEGQKQLKQAIYEGEEKRQQAIDEGQKKRKQITIVGGVILAAALIVAGFFSWKAGEQKIEADKQIEIAQEATKRADQKGKEADQKGRDVEYLNNQLNNKKDELDSQKTELTRVKNEAANQQKQADRAIKDAENADKKAQGAQKVALKAQGDLTKTQVEKEKLRKEAIRLQVEANRMENKAQEAKILLEKAKTDLNQYQNEQQFILENNNNVDELSKLIDDLYGNDKQEDERQPEAAKDAIAQIGLSFTDFTDNKPELKKALLKSSIALAYLHIDPLDKNGKAKQAINESVHLIESNPALFKSDQGQFIAFFSYAVLGNLLEEQNPKSIPVAYEKAFSYQGIPFSASDRNKSSVKDSYGKVYRRYMVNNSSLSEGGARWFFDFQSLTNASGKKHFEFLEKQAIQSLQSLLARKEWLEADRVTADLIEASIRSKGIESYRFGDLSCSTLTAIDALWFKYSAGRFGFKVQREIWLKPVNTLGLETGNTLDGRYDDEAKASFYNRVGWTRTDDARSLNNQLEDAPTGYFPTTLREIPNTTSLLLIIDDCINQSKPIPLSDVDVNEKIINIFYAVPGITNADSADSVKATKLFELSNGSVLKKYINYFGVYHVFLENSKGVVVASFYVGWIHTQGLEEAITKIKKEFGIDPEK